MDGGSCKGNPIENASAATGVHSQPRSRSFHYPYLLLSCFRGALSFSQFFRLQVVCSPTVILICVPLRRQRRLPVGFSLCAPGVWSTAQHSTAPHGWLEGPTQEEPRAAQIPWSVTLHTIQRYHTIPHASSRLPACQR